jgi:hypothetical protein
MLSDVAFLTLMVPAGFEALQLMVSYTDVTCQPNLLLQLIKTARKRDGIRHGYLLGGFALPGFSATW